MNWLWRGNSDVVFKTYDEQKKDKLKKNILIFLGSAVVVVLLATFFLLLSYDFDIENAIGSRDVVVEGDEKKYTVKDVSGEENIILYCTDDDETTIKFLCAIKVNMDKKEIIALPISVSEKIFTCNLKKVNAGECYNYAGVSQLVECVNEYTGVDFKKYIGCKEGNIEGIIANFDELTVSFDKNMIFKKGADTITFKKGKHTVTDDVVYKLLTYSAGEETYLFRADLILQMFKQYCNQTSLENRNMIYSNIINQSDSNISVVDFASYKDHIVVLASDKVKKKYIVVTDASDFRE